MVGASLAVALEGVGVRTALIEAVPHDAAAQPSFDERTTALSNGSRRILETLGVWPDLAMRRPESPRSTSRTEGISASPASTRRSWDAMPWVMSCPTARSAPRSGRACRAAPDLDVFCPARVATDRHPRGCGRDRDRSRPGPAGAPGGGRRRDRLDGAQGVRHRRGDARLRASRDHHDRVAGKVSRARGLRALHLFRPARVAAARRRPLHAGVDVEPGGGRSGDGLVRRGVPRRGAGAFRLAAGPALEGRTGARIPCP